MNTTNKKTNGHTVNGTTLASKPTTRLPAKTLAEEHGFSNYEIARLALYLRKADGRLNFPLSNFFGDAVKILVDVKTFQTKNTLNEALTVARAGKELSAAELSYCGFEELTDKGGLMADLYQDTEELRATLKRWAKDGQMTNATRLLAKTLLKEGRANTLELLQMRMILQNEGQRVAAVS